MHYFLCIKNTVTLIEEHLFLLFIQLIDPSTHKALNYNTLFEMYFPKRNHLSESYQKSGNE